VSFMIGVGSDIEVSHASLLKGLKSIADMPLNIDLLNVKLDILIQSEAARLHVNMVTPLIVTLIGASMVMASITMVEYAIPRSFILLNDYTVNKRQQYAAGGNPAAHVLVLCPPSSALHSRPQGCCRPGK